jgi:hypothetical protein
MGPNLTVETHESKVEDVPSGGGTTEVEKIRWLSDLSELSEFEV